MAAIICLKIELDGMYLINKILMVFKLFCGRVPNKQSNNTTELFALIKLLEIGFEINLPVHIHT
jgi:hypothetical protein